MTPSPDTLLSLYHSGAFLCTGIVAVYLLLRWGSTRIAWLEVPNRAHYVTAFLAGLALVLPPAVQGQTPSASMIAAAIGTIVALLLPGAVATSSKSQSGIVSRRLIAILSVFALAGVACWSTVKKDASTVGSDVDTCASAEKAAIGSGQSVIDVVIEATAAAIAAASGNYAPGEALILQYGEPLASCVLGKLAHPPQIAAGSGITTTPAPPLATQKAPDPVAVGASVILKNHRWTKAVAP